MISNTSFRTAVNVLDGLTSHKASVIPSSVVPSIEFEKEYEGQHNITTALKIINKAVLEGADSQKAELLSSRHQIISLNKLLKGDSFNAEVKDKFGVDMGDETAKIKGMQIAIPQTSFEKMVETATKIPRIIFTILCDILLLPAALALLLVARCKSNFNPKPEDVKQRTTPILLLHGSGFNQSEWVVGRQFLKNQEYGSVFSLNYDGLASNDPTKGVEDYAQDKISKEIKRIKELTGSDRIILMGHSMGGLIAGYYAENLAKADEVNVEHVISIATPWQGTPSIDCFWKLGGRFSKERESKRHQQMSLSGGTETDPKFRQNLVAKALNSERKGVRKYYNIWSTTDYAVPGAHGRVTEDPRRQRSFSYLGHYALVAWPSVWLQTRAWLNEIYATESAAATAPVGLACQPAF